MSVTIALVAFFGVLLSLWLYCSISKSKKEEESKSDSAVEGHLPLKLQCVACLSKICPCLVQPPVPESV